MTQNTATPLQNDGLNKGAVLRATAHRVWEYVSDGRIPDTEIRSPTKSISSFDFRVSDSSHRLVIIVRRAVVAHDIVTDKPK